MSQRNIKKSTPLFISLTGILMVISVAIADPSYTAIDLGTLQGGENNSWGWGINELGQAVGHSDAPNGMSIHAFIWEDGEMTDLRTLGGTYSWAYGINNSSQVTGYSFVNGLTIHGFFWVKGKMHDIGSLPGARGTFSRGNDINEEGIIVGVSHSTRPGWIVPYTGFMLDHSDMFNISTEDWLELPTFGGDESQAFGVNDLGDTVGWARYEPPNPTAPRAFLYSKGQMIDLGTFGGNLSEAEDINNNGQIVGWASNADGLFRAFVWEDSVLTDLGDFGGEESWAYGINDAGQIVGKARLPDGTKHGFLLDNGIMWDLNDIVQPGLDVVFHGARDINELGQIVTSAELPDETRHAYILTPDLLDLEDPSPLTAGRVNIFSVRNATPGETVDFFWGLRSASTLIDKSGLYLSIENPETLGSEIANSNGIAMVSAFVPEQAVGQRIFLQAYEGSSRRPSKLIRVTIE